MLSAKVTPRHKHIGTMQHVWGGRFSWQASPSTIRSKWARTVKIREDGQGKFLQPIAEGAFDDLEAGEGTIINETLNGGDEEPMEELDST